MYQGYDGQRIGLQAEWLIEFIKMHSINHPEAKFKIGNEVIYSNLDIVHKPIVCKILAVNVQDKDQVEFIKSHNKNHPEAKFKIGVEYAISNVYANLVYEEELTKRRK